MSGDDQPTPDALQPDSPAPVIDGPDNCSEAAKHAYVVDQDNTLSTFTPPGTFADLGVLNCSSSSTPFSMGVDRNAMAWVLYADGTLYNVDLNTLPLTCTHTAWQPGNLGNQVFGMGFSTDVSGGDTDTLYIAGGQAFAAGAHAQLSSLDLATSPIGSIAIGTDLLPGWPELTGNSLAELWGFFPSADGSTPTQVGRIDKDTATVDPIYSFPGLGGGLSPSAWAFAFYGGTYYMFLATGSNTVVYAMDENGTLESTTGTQTTRNIVGAGVSTCAPIVVGRQ
jgi:hypothetical protein